MLNCCVLVLFVFFNISQSITCLNDDIKEREWIIGYKFPHSFSYATFDNFDLEWKPSKFNIAKQGALKESMEFGMSLSNHSDTAWFVYNDERTGEKYSMKYGHTKGMVAFDKLTNSGVWIIHSIPKLPEYNTTYSYPHSGFVYGQHFLCVTLDFAQLSSIVSLFKQSRPYIQGFHVGEEISKNFPDLVKLINLVKFDNPETYDIQKMQTNGKDKLEMFAFYKSPIFNKDLYDDLVAVNLNASLGVETWQHGKEILPSACHENYKVINIKLVSFNKYGIDQTFPESEDHAKWAVSIENEAKKIVCLGDINRMESQFHRGGGTLCIVNENIWNQFKNLPEKFETC